MAGGNANSGTWFRECIALNTTIVMPTAFTNSTVVQMFRETANASNIKNVVYLGDMESIAWSERNHHINFIFANPNDTDISSVTFSSFYNNLNSDCYFYFCSTGYRYTMAVASADKIADTLVKNSYRHLHNPNADSYKDATCTDAAGDYQFCFCGTPIGFVQNGSDALGHVYNNVINMYFENNNYYADATYVYACPQCEKDVERDETNTSLFTKSGFSASEDDFGDVVFIVYINDKNIKAYLNKNEGVELSYGLVASANVTGTPLSYVNGKVEADKNTVKIDMTGLSYNKLTMRVKNVGDYSLHCAGYVSFDGVISYLNHETVDNTAATVSLSVIDAMLNPVTPPPSNEEQVA